MDSGKEVGQGEAVHLQDDMLRACSWWQKDGSYAVLGAEPLRGLQSSSHSVGFLVLVPQEGVRWQKADLSLKVGAERETMVSPKRWERQDAGLSHPILGVPRLHLGCHSGMREGAPAGCCCNYGTHTQKHMDDVS